MKVFITGASGFLGKRVTQFLLDSGEYKEIRILARENSDVSSFTQYSQVYYINTFRKLNLE